MSRFEQDDIDFGHHDDGRGAVGRVGRRYRQVVGAVGLAVLIGGGAFLVTETLNDEAGVIATDSLPQTSMTPPSDPRSAQPSAAQAGPSGIARTVSPRPVPSVSITSKSVEQEIRDARRAAAKDGVPLQRPRATQPVTAADVTVTDSGSLRKDRTTLRVVSARADLTGQRELGWVAGGAERHGDAMCSQTVQFANSGGPHKIPNMLICWHTSATRSVITVMVNVDGHPSRRDSVAALDKRWAELG